MEERVLSGREAIARGAIEAGVGLVTGCPGPHGQEVIDYLVSAEEKLPLHWAVNEKVAVETALGASLAGARSLVCLHGINLALDPLITINLLGIRGGMVILCEDDPGAWYSQNEQDSRLLGPFAELPLLEPASPGEGREMILDSYRLSEKVGLPVLIRVTPNFYLAEETLPSAVKIPPPPRPAPSPEREMRWVASPVSVLENHNLLHQRIRRVREEFELSPFNQVLGYGKKGIIAAGFVFNKLMEVLGGETDHQFRLLKLSTLHPLPENQVKDFLTSTEEVLILEENEPFVETRIRELSYQMEERVRLWGKLTGHVPREGELFKWEIEEILGDYLTEFTPRGTFFPYQEQKERPTQEEFCLSCPYLLVFKALAELREREGEFLLVGDVGCIMKANLPPQKMLDVNLSPGSSITLASGMSKVSGQRKVVALIGDSSFFHSGINGVIDVAYNQGDLLIIVMDNSVAAGSGLHPHPGTGRNLWGEKVPKLDIEDFLIASGLSYVRVTELESYPETKALLQEALNREGLRAVIVRKPCPLI